MRQSRIVIAIASLAAIHASAAEINAGIATISEGGSACISLPAPALKPGDRVSLVRFDPPQLATVAVIKQAVSTCPDLKRAAIEGPFYLAQQQPGAVQAEPGLWIALRGELPWTGSDGSVRIKLSESAPAARVRSCTSAEGMHLTLWADAPLRSRRLWHLYFYLGYDTVPSCEKADFAH